MNIPCLLPESARKKLVYAVNELPLEPYILCAGVYAGGDIITMHQARPDASFIIFDSFQGLAEPTELDNPEASAGKFAYRLDSFIKNVARINIKIYPGFITPESLMGIKPEWPLDMIWMDLDHGEPTRAILNHFLPLMFHDGVVMTHDYSNHNYPGIKTVCDTFGDWEDIGDTIGRLKK